MIKSNRNFKIHHRIQEAYKTYYKYKSIMKSRNISTNTKIRVYRATFRPLVTWCRNNERSKTGTEKAKKIREKDSKILQNILIEETCRR